MTLTCLSETIISRMSCLYSFDLSSLLPLPSLYTRVQVNCYQLCELSLSFLIETCYLLNTRADCFVFCLFISWVAMLFVRILLQALHTTSTSSLPPAFKLLLHPNVTLRVRRGCWQSSRHKGRSMTLSSACGSHRSYSHLPG